MNVSPDWLPVLIPLYFVAVWLGVGLLVSRMGWHAFAVKYPARFRPSGDSYTCPRARFGSIFASYKNVMRLTFCDQGIHVHAMFLFRAFHAPFLLPWNTILAARKVEGLFGDRYRLEVSDEAGEIHIVLKAAAMRALTRMEAHAHPMDLTDVPRNTPPESRRRGRAQVPGTPG